MVVDLDLKREKSILLLSETMQNYMFNLQLSGGVPSQTVRVKEKTVIVRCHDRIVLHCPERGRIARVVTNHVCLILNSVSSYCLLLALLMI